MSEPRAALQGLNWARLCREYDLCSVRLSKIDPHPRDHCRSPVREWNHGQGAGRRLRDGFMFEAYFDAPNTSAGTRLLGFTSFSWYELFFCLALVHVIDFFISHCC